MKKIILIITCFLLSTAFVNANFVLHSYAGDTSLTKTELKQSQKPTKKIIDSLQLNQFNKDDMYTIYIPLNIRTVFEESIARQLKARNKLNAFSTANINDKKSIDNFTKENVGVFINAFIEAVDFCIPTNKYNGLKDQTQCETETKWQIGRFQYIAHNLRDKYPEECWKYIKPQIFTYNNNFNFRTNPAPIKIIQSLTMGNSFITNKIINDENFFQEFRKYYVFHKRAGLSFGMSRSLDEAYKLKSTAELGLLLEEDWNYKYSSPYSLDTHYIDHTALNAVYSKKTEESYRIYEEFEKRRMKSWDTKKESYKKWITDTKNGLENYRKLVDRHERLRKEAEKGKSEEQVFAEYTADLRKREKDLIKMNLDSKDSIKIYFAQLKATQKLSDKYPKGRLYFHTGDCTRKIVNEAKPEFKEVYWQYMNEKQKDNQENKLDQIIAGTAGAAFGKVMTEEDLPRAFDYMNNQRSFKLIDLISFHKDTPPLAHKSASISMLQGLVKNDRTNMVVYFIKRYKKIKDPDLRRGFLEMAPKFGLTNYPKP
ncbi:hypothetical protein KAH27_06735 [bacterium]|nr:hypothetical protein [bacterium]